MHRADAAQPLIRQLRNAQVGQTVLHTGAHRGRDGRRLFVDLLQHEVRVAALFSGFLIPVGGQNFSLHRLRELIVEADAVGVHHRHVPLFQHAVPAGIFQQRRDIRRNKVFRFAPAHDERALPLDREQGIREIPEQDSQRIAAPYHGQSSAQGFEGLPLITAVDELDQDLGVGLALKGIALGHEPLLQHTIVLDDAVVDDAHPGRGMRVAVHIAGLPVGRPPGVADAAAAPGQGLHRQPLAQLRQTALALDHPDAALQSQGHTGGIIAAVLQLFQTIQQNILCIPFSNITNNATHTKHLHADSPAQKTRAAQLSASCNSLCSCMAFFEGICYGITADFCPSLRLV